MVYNLDGSTIRSAQSHVRHRHHLHVRAVRSVALGRGQEAHVNTSYVERTIDGVLALLLLVAGIIVASSNQYKTYDSVNASLLTNYAAYLFHCGSMNANLVFSFVSIMI